MARLSKEKQKAIRNGMHEASSRSRKFRDLISEFPKPNPNIKNPTETNKGVSLVKEMIEREYNIYDVLCDYKKGAISSKDDTHSAPRKWEKWLGGRGDGDPTPDTQHSEIKLNQVDKKHELPSKNPVLNIGKIQPKGKNYKIFEESSCYQKMKRMWITTHSNNYSKIEGTFVFEVDHEQWFDRIKEDYEFYLNEYQKRLLTGQRSSKSSVVSSTTLSPNGTLCIRSDAIMITKDFFREVSKHYDK